MRTGFLTMSPDIPNAQLKPRILPADPVPVPNPRPEQYTWDNGLQGFTMYSVDPPTPGPLAPFYPKSYVIDQVTNQSGITPPVLQDFSGTIAANQVAQALIPSDPNRTYICLFNPTFLPLAVSFTTAAFNLTTSIVINTGQALLWSITTNTDINLGAMTIAGFEVGQPYYAFVSNGGAGLLNDGGVLQLSLPAGYPTSSIGLAPGAVWNNGLAIAVVPGSTPDPTIPDLFFGQVSASELLFFGGSNLPTSPPLDGSLQLWNNDGEVSVA
jgi:hypothetical protein